MEEAKLKVIAELFVETIRVFMKDHLYVPGKGMLVTDAVTVLGFGYLVSVTHIENEAKIKFVEEELKMLLKTYQEGEKNEQRTSD